MLMFKQHWSKLVVLINKGKRKTGMMPVFLITSVFTTLHSAVRAVHIHSVIQSLDHPAESYR